ncbi:MAG: porin [Chitinophagaceae bacterium]|nr:MAG: porin [Chitinophagaceae bacterium]
MRPNIFLFFLLLFLCHSGRAQFLMDMIDTTTSTGKRLIGVLNEYDHLRFSGYIQPQFQVAESKGINAFEGGDFNERVSNRFMFRRSRIRIDYVHFDRGTKPGVQIAFQFDVNERGFTMRDVWGRIFENRYKLFSFTTGMFARPFGYETNLSSSERESPERGRMNQILMKSERDLGAMLSFDVRKEKHPLKFLKVDVGVFNGQGITADGDFDNRKDIIGRVALKPKAISKKVTLSAGASFLYGGLERNTRYLYFTSDQKLLIDSSLSNEGSVSPRHYYGADAQLEFANKKGKTILRGEYIAGKQTGTPEDSETPTELLTGFEGYYARDFKGAYVYLLQNIFSERHQLLFKYDFYDPNSDVKKRNVGAEGSNFSPADVRYDTYGFGYINYLSDNFKLVLYYAHVRNEKTSIPGFTEDVKDDVFTARLQFRF